MVSPERLDALQTQWVRLLAGYGVLPERAYPVFDRLVTAYTEPHRHYHTLEHVAETLKIAGRLSRFADDLATVQLAVWFHDVVYDPRAKDNEERSALLAAECLDGELVIGPGVVAKVIDLIRTTKHTSAPPADRNTAVLLDADLAIIAAAEPRYDRYAADIRKEFAHVPDVDYRAGRIGVLESFLARPRIYHTDPMFQEGEAAARRNLAAEIGRLRGSSSPPRFGEGRKSPCQTGSFEPGTPVAHSKEVACRAYPAPTRTPTRPGGKETHPPWTSTDSPKRPARRWPARRSWPPSSGTNRSTSNTSCSPCSTRSAVSSRPS